MAVSPNRASPGNDPGAAEPVQLARRIGLPLVTLYGLGTIIGAGIYVLIGEVAGAAGILAPFAFVFAALIATVTAMSFAQLSAWFPRSAGEAVYVLKGFQNKSLSTLTGWLVVLTGIVSSATMANGVLGYVQVFVPVADWLGITFIVLLFGVIAMWGIAESMWIAAGMTLLSIVGLVLVIALAGGVIFDLPRDLSDYLVPGSVTGFSAVLAGAFLAFYAFIGFEDIVNVAEEVRDPEKNMPRAIFLSIGIATLFYMVIAIIAVGTISPQELAASSSPLALLLSDRGTAVMNVISLISIFAIVNGLLIQVVMGSRVLYGLAMQGSAPRRLSTVNARTRTPIVATSLVVVLVLVFALWLPLVALAKLTSFVILVVFALVNLALWRLASGVAPGAGPKTVRCFPLAGALLCLLLLGFQVRELLS